MRYHLQEAYDFYKKFIYNEEKQVLLTKHNFRIAGSVPSVDWELFGAILTGDDGKGGYGSDLLHHEIKSSVGVSSFEYQYHLHGGEQKLLDDAIVNHLFISYSPDYKNIEVRLVQGSFLKSKFQSWLSALRKNYRGNNPRQRYRRSIPYGTVKKEGKLMMKVELGELVSLGN